MRSLFIFLTASLTLFVSNAFAADPGFCNGYATAAVRQAERARDWPTLPAGIGRHALDYGLSSSLRLVHHGAL
jgi:hypothetical protein